MNHIYEHIIMRVTGGEGGRVACLHCTKRNIKKVMLEYDWRTVARYRDHWRKVVHKREIARERGCERDREREREEK